MNGSNIYGFWSLTQARFVLGDWTRGYNHHRRHSALSYLPPARCAVACTFQFAIDPLYL